MNCQTVTNIYLQEYNSDIEETSRLLEKINSYVEGQKAKWEGYQTKYVENLMTLDYIRTNFDFMYLSSLVNRKETWLETVMNKHIQTVHKLRIRSAVSITSF